MTPLFFEHALLPDGWNKAVRVDVGPDGTISGILTDARPDGAEFTGRIAVPGMPNLHSHAFQRAMAGLTETKGDGDDSFWTWRRIMYGFVARITPADLTAIARQLYVEMLEAGFTAVAEFHYLHHDIDGRPYDDIGAMAAAVAEAAGEAGIGLTLLPVFYQNGGFGGQPATEGQHRFVTEPDRFLRLVERTRAVAAGLDDAVVGIAPHSLRAVTPESLAEVCRGAGDGPIHIHIAEQLKEVDDCLAWSGSRPVAWLVDNVDVDRRWCLVHATHMTGGERRAVAESGAIAGLCPITEANLGDGIFDGAAFLGDGGGFGIGSDSNVFIGVAEELRLLEYTQRLRDHARNVLAPTGGSTGRALYRHALDGGANACGRRIGRLAPGYRADIVSLDADHPALLCRTGDGWLDGWLFAGDNSVVGDVWVGGRRMVADGRHVNRLAAARSFRETLTRLVNP